MTAKALFIVSSGRSGSAMMEKLFRALPGVDMQHEYMVHITQKLGCRYAMGLADDAEAMNILRETHLAAVTHAPAAVWGDSSNKLSWLIRPLAELMPEARFVHLTRDGRKVSGSYLRKLGAECYDDISTTALGRWLSASDGVPPPPEKKYWWPHPTMDDPDAARWPGFSQFERIAWHWNAINREIALACAELAPDRTLRVRLEDLVRDRGVFDRFVRFCWSEPGDDAFALMQRPHNVNRPDDAPLSSAETADFWRVAAEQMDALGYAGEPEYAMRY